MRFGECICGAAIERAGWDDLCFRCQESEKAELVDDDNEFACGTCGRPMPVSGVSECCLCADERDGLA